MTIEYDITKDDIHAFNLYHSTQSPSARRSYLRAWLIPALVWLFLCVMIWSSAIAVGNDIPPLKAFLDLLPLFCGVPLYLIAFPWYYRRKLRKTIAAMVDEGENRGLFGLRKVSITPEIIAQSGEYGQSSTSWKAVERIVQNNDYAFIYLNALAAIIIPRHAFPNSSEFETFMSTAGSYYERSK